MTNRQSWVDVFRGLLIAHMALDHASLFFNSHRAAEELAATGAPAFDGFWQFITRFLGVPVAPGFCFMAGFMVAITSAGREERGISHRDVTRRLILRGLLLIAVDAVIMGLPRALMGFYSFMVLSSIGVAIIVLALIRDVTSRVLLPVAVGILFLHPLIDVSGWPVWLQAVVYEPVREGAFRSMYPVLPWIGVVLLGFVVGRDSLTRERPARMWLAVSTVSFVLFFVVRLGGGYGNAYPTGDIGSQQFWTFAKYPPDLAFLTWSMGCIFLAMAALSQMKKPSIAGRLGGGATRFVARLVATFGRVPFFFYVVHFYVLGIAQAITQTKVDLATVYAIWIVLLLVMAWPCARYYDFSLSRRSRK